jgi:hypothetical protein
LPARKNLVDRDGKIAKKFFTVYSWMPCSISEVQPAELWKKSLERFSIRIYFVIYAFLVSRPFRHLESAEISSWLAGAGIECTA